MFVFYGVYSVVQKIISFSDKNFSIAKYLSSIKTKEKMNNSIQYSEDFKLLKWNDFNFEPIEINTLSILEDPKHYKNSFTFRDAIIDAIETRSGKKIFKLSLVTPDYKSSKKFYGIGFLEERTVGLAKST